MKLIDLDPKWILKGGKRVGLLFRNPVRGGEGWWTTCFFEPTPKDEQEALVEGILGDDPKHQGCNPSVGWKCVGGDVEEASFESISITPSLDGGPHFWHGHITDGTITGV